MVSVACKLSTIREQHTRRLQEQKPLPQKTVLDLISGEDGFCSLETKYDRRMAKTKVVFLKWRLQKQRSQPRKNCPGFDAYKILARKSEGKRSLENTVTGGRTIQITQLRKCMDSITILAHSSEFELCEWHK
jgi:hypothetical protein